MALKDFQTLSIYLSRTLKKDFQISPYKISHKSRRPQPPALAQKIGLSVERAALSPSRFLTQHSLVEVLSVFWYGDFMRAGGEGGWWELVGFGGVGVLCWDCGGYCWWFFITYVSDINLVSFTARGFRNVHF